MYTNTGQRPKAKTRLGQELPLNIACLHAQPPLSPDLTGSLGSVVAQKRWVSQDARIRLGVSVWSRGRVALRVT